MSEIPGMIKPDLWELPKLSDRMTFLYLEHCKLNRQNFFTKQGYRYDQDSKAESALFHQHCHGRKECQGLQGYIAEIQLSVIYADRLS